MLTPHDRPYARNQLYDLVLDARVGVLAEAALVSGGGEANCCSHVSFHAVFCFFFGLVLGVLGAAVGSVGMALVKSKRTAREEAVF